MHSHITRSSTLRRLPLLALLIAAATLAFPHRVKAQNKRVAAEDQKRITALSEAVLACQLEDGAIPAVGYREAGQPAFIEPYFSNLACLGLLSAGGQAPEEQITTYIDRWLDWCIANQEADGTFKRFSGAIGKVRRLSPNRQFLRPDSDDSYAATFLAVASAWTVASKRPPREPLIEACRKSFQVLERCRDKSNGLYWNFAREQAPAGVTPAQYLLDNVEVHQGLTAAHSFFSKAGQVELAAQARTRANELANNMHKFWSPDDQYFVCMYGDKLARVPWGKQPVAAEGLSTVSALAFFDNVSAKTRSELWDKFWRTHGRVVANSFTTERYVTEDPTVERVYLAALRSASPEQQKQIMASVRRRTDNLLQRQSQLDDPEKSALPYPYVHRYGMLIQALLSQDGEIPAELPRITLSEANAP